MYSMCVTFGEALKRAVLSVVNRREVMDWLGKFGSWGVRIRLRFSDMFLGMPRNKK